MGSTFTAVWFCLKSTALFIVIKVPPSSPLLLQSPQPYIILISTELRVRREKEGLRLLQPTEEDRVSRVSVMKERPRCVAEWFS